MLLQKKHPLILFLLLFQRIPQSPGQNQQNGKKQSASCLPSPSELSIYPHTYPHIDPLVLYLSPDFLLNFLSNLHISS